MSLISGWRRHPDALALLDEVGNAEVCELFTVKNFMVHFSLKQETDELDDLVPVELEGFGEETVDTLSERVYPAYFKAAITEGENWPDDREEESQAKVNAVLQSLNAALVKERTRRWGAKETGDFRRPGGGSPPESRA